ncbi:MAG: ECF transporter S component [Erysipelotrichaceae bacterium]|nr:ECF transporter S component [Erysipelotrichaceae bacterium]
MKKNQKIAFLSIGIALYVVLSAFVIIPIINRIKLDLGYIVFGLYLNAFGIPATVVGVLGCILGNLLKGGSFRIAWPIGQAFIGLSLGYLLPKTKNIWLKILYSIISVFIGIAVIKTLIEVAMYQFPLGLKFSSNLVAFIADVIPFIIGILLNQKIKIIR